MHWIQTAHFYHATREETGRLRTKQEQLSERHQKLLSYLITGAAANLSKSEEVEKTVLLLRLCASIICQINSKKEIVTYYDASILDNAAYYCLNV